MIDNSSNVYVPIRLACGVTAKCRPDVFVNDSPRILSILQDDLTRCFDVLPVSVHRWIRRRVTIWVNVTYTIANSTDLHQNTQSTTCLNHMCTHHSAAWLHAARDRPDKVGGIEIYNIHDYLRMRWHWNGCGLLLHELCHVIHDRVLGLDCLRIQRIYYKARASGKYENVLRRDWAGEDQGERDLAYCMVDYKEFFAEMSVTYLSQGYCGLDSSPSTCIASCSPPIQEPGVKERIIRKGIIDSDTEETGLMTLIRRSLFPEWRCDLDGHCNKFYPFTRGQLQHHDPELFNDMEAIWSDVADWEDSSQDTECCFPVLSKPRWWKRRTSAAESTMIPLIAHASIGDTVDL